MSPFDNLMIDSEVDVSKHVLREKLKKDQTTRNIRNKTIDVTSLGDFEFRSAKR